MTRPAKMFLSLALCALLICLATTQLKCRDRGGSPKAVSAGDTPDADAVAINLPPTTLPTAGSSVRVSIKMVVHRKYGKLARLTGRKDSTKSDTDYDAAKNWWDNPMVIFDDAAYQASAVTTDADSAAITGRGRSANVRVDLTLVPHADITADPLAASDCLKGTLTATISTESDYYDGKWTAVARATDTPIAFNFDTSEPSKPLRPTTSEERTFPPFSFERYAREHEKWSPKSAWPTKPQNGDWRCTIYVKDARLVLTGYQYAPPEPATAETRDAEQGTRNIE